MMQMFEVHVRPEVLTEGILTEEHIKGLRTQIEDVLSLQKSKIKVPEFSKDGKYELKEMEVNRLQVVPQDLEICSVMDQF
jgi:alkylated DNA repair dioxygenase AlkB